MITKLILANLKNSPKRKKVLTDKVYCVETKKASTRERVAKYMNQTADKCSVSGVHT